MNLKILNFFNRKSRHQKMLDLLKFYWTDKKYPNKNELKNELIQLGYSSKESYQITDKFFSEALFNKELNEDIVESIREEVTDLIKNEVKTTTGKDTPDNTSSQLFDIIKNNEIEKYNEKKAPFLQQFLKHLFQAVIESPAPGMEILMGSNLKSEVKVCIPKETVYFYIFSLIYFLPTLKKVKEKYSVDDTKSIYNDLIQNVFNEYSFYIESEKLHPIEYELDHAYYQGCLDNPNTTGDNEIEKLSLAFMMKLVGFKPENSNLENSNNKEQLLMIYNFAKKIVESVVNAYRQAE